MSDVEGLNVSRETIGRLEVYEALLHKWNPRINLVSRASLASSWHRHILDSMQIYKLAPHPVDHWVDIGSGGGFPGLVMAIMAMENGSPSRVTLVESDTRKCAFLRSVIRETGAPAEVINDRIENISPLKADVVSARALADLSALLSYVDQHLNRNGVAIFPKGASWKNEMEKAQRAWSFSYQVAKSATETGPVILTIAGVARA
jgi:16S rRNA (guanine527-N7)-methyltransferase